MVVSKGPQETKAFLTLCTYSIKEVFSRKKQQIAQVAQREGSANDPYVWAPIEAVPRSLSEKGGQ